MVVLNVTYKCKQGMREAFLKAIKSEGIDMTCRGEAGNVKYDYYMSAEDENEMLLLEKWEDENALSEHTRQSHFQRLGEMKADYVNDTLIEKYISE